MLTDVACCRNCMAMLFNLQCFIVIGQLPQSHPCPWQSADYPYSRQLATVCGINNFSIADLTRPDPSRFRSQMSGIMNFAKFRHVNIRPNRTCSKGFATDLSIGKKDHHFNLICKLESNVKLKSMPFPNNRVYMANGCRTVRLRRQLDEIEGTIEDIT